ncbi:MAG: hypothetical protein C5B58_06275 [Acidobacteria bacterium]|nr:MAG: hypothetical protein C5B58_06275 [Acidobacteriota bacterium]
MYLSERPTLTHIVRCLKEEKRSQVGSVISDLAHPSDYANPSQTAGSPSIRSKILNWMPGEMLDQGQMPPTIRFACSDPRRQR